MCGTPKGVPPGIGCANDFCTMHDAHKIVSVSRRFCKNPMYTPGNANTFNLQKQMVYFAYASV